MGYRIRPLVAALAVAFSGVAFAQTGPQVMDTVSVTAKRETPLPNSAGAMNAVEVAGQRAYVSDTAQLLRDVPGVSLSTGGGVSSLPNIHGLADDRLRISVDGMDFIASCPNHMNPPLSYLNPNSVGKIKVYAGITPVSVGGDSIGGTIIAETLAPEFAAPGQGMLAKGEIGGYYRSNGDAFGVNAAATVATESFNISYTGGLAKADNYDAGGNFKTLSATGRVGHTLPLDEVGSSAYETRTHTLGFALKGGNHLLEAKLGFQQVPEQLYPNQRMDMLDNDQKRFNLHYLGQFDWGSLDARAYRETVDHFMDFGADKRFWYGNGAPPTGSGGSAGFDGLGNGFPCSPVGTSTCAAGMPMYSESKTTGFNLKADVVLNEQNFLRIGGLVQSYQLDDYWTASGGGMAPGTFQNINQGERDRTAVFGEWESRFNPQWMSLLGVRYERVASDAGNVHGYSTSAMAMGNQVIDATAFNAQSHERNDNNWDATALARYTANANYDIEFGFARKVRSPNLYERYTWSTWSMAAVMNNFVGDGNGYIGNINLEPEKAHTLSATFDWHAADHNWGFKATPYFTKVQDYIDAIRCTRSACKSMPTNATTTNQFVVLEYANQSARLYGLDLSGYMPLGKSVAGDFTLKGLLNYTNGKNEDTGDELYNIMPLNAKLVIGQKLSGWDNAVELVAVKGKDDGSDVRNEIKTPGYGLTNLRASYTWKRVRLDFGVENLFDKLYTLPQGGAYVGQGTTMATNAASMPWGIGVPGMGRSLYTGVNIKF
ncbi:MAG: TonB-dependent receptor [Rhodocyclaceae bacterium]|nr:TonB-dependent receptor [Rhodocyclaceae bacterium]